MELQQDDCESGPFFAHRKQTRVRSFRTSSIIDIMSLVEYLDKLSDDEVNP